ncbi:MAG: 2-oxoacid:acceptor oxidoreductase family protein, partial [Planctomycetota bacterium]
ARERDLNFKQAEVHGMAQRGGAVISHLRVSSEAIYSDLVPRGSADVLLAVEPLEALRQAHYLSPRGVMVSSSSPVTNIADYPDLHGVLERIAAFEQHLLLDANYLATVAGSSRAANMAVLGAGGWKLGFGLEELEEQVRALFAGQSGRIAEANCKALGLGALAAKLYLDQRAAGRSPSETLQTISRIPPAQFIEQIGQESAAPDAANRGSLRAAS